MRAKILGMLRQAADGYVSGEAISQHLAVSRAAIWKHIQALRQEGYHIEAHPRLGYRLLAAPDRLSPEEIGQVLATARFGRAISYREAVTSTNDVARELALAGCPGGQIVVAETQTGGRGRLARSWFAPPGKGIWFSIILRPPIRPQDAPKCTLLAAVAVNAAIRRISGVPSGIKWPNDILYKGKKLVGILTEMAAEMDAVNYIVLGIGVNVNIATEDFPPELRAVATSLFAAAGQPVPRSLLLAAILEELESLYDEVCQAGFGPVLDKWREYSVTLGKEVKIIDRETSFSGQAVDIDTDGALLVQTADGMKKVVAGDVSLRAR